MKIVLYCDYRGTKRKMTRKLNTIIYTTQENNNKKQRFYLLFQHGLNVDLEGFIINKSKLNEKLTLED